MDITNKEVVALSRKWKRILGIGKPWRVTLQINRTREQAGESAYAAGHNAIQEGYFLSDITINLFHHDTLEELEDTVVHELTHILLARMSAVMASGGRKLRKVAKHAEEAAVVHLTSAMLALDRRKS